MRFLRRSTFWRRLPRRVGVCAALVAYLVATVGFPVPAATPATVNDPAPAHSPSCCCPPAEQASGCCCCSAHQVPACCRNKGHAAPAAADSIVRWVGGPSARGCQGLSTVWIASGAVTPPPASLTWIPFAAPEGWLSSAQDYPFRLALIPPDPPPRSLCA